MQEMAFLPLFLLVIPELLRRLSLPFCKVSVCRRNIKIYRPLFRPFPVRVRTALLLSRS